MWRLLRPDSASVFEDPKVRSSLGRYIGVAEDLKAAKFVLSKSMGTGEPLAGVSTEGLWERHRRLLGDFKRFEGMADGGAPLRRADPSFLDLKAEIARRMMSSCSFCTRGCKANRLAGEAGYCKCGSEVAVSSLFAHMGEEPELVPSGTIFTMGCTMACIYCQNWEISQWVDVGERRSPEWLSRGVEGLRGQGCRNANLVGGEPTPWLWHWLEAFKRVSVNVPVVWNSNGYYSEGTAELLKGFVDVYLLDFKYGPGGCAERLSDAPGYWEACARNHLSAIEWGEVIVRVLVLPGHLECCTEPVLEWIASQLGRGTRVNLMFQFRPEWRAKEGGLGRRLSRDEERRAVRMAIDAGLENFIV
uniref:Radical SAM protein n=1 Tax=Candidatus Methanomethylicus mesodigestus TaxID=1867258 RepID=A0A7C3EX10_9CREN